MEAVACFMAGQKRINQAIKAGLKLGFSAEAKGREGGSGLCLQV